MKLLSNDWTDAGYVIGISGGMMLFVHWSWIFGVAFGFYLTYKMKKHDTIHVKEENK